MTCIILFVVSSLQRCFRWNVAQRFAFWYLAVVSSSLTGFATPGSQDPNFKLFAIGGQLSDLDVQSDGKLIVAGDLMYANGTGAGQLLRLNSDGTIDRSFPAIRTGSRTISGVRVQPDGKILVAGSFTEFAGTARRGLVRLHRDGTVDQSFELVGATVTPPLVLQPDGKIIGSGPTLIRLVPDGGFDGSFQSSPGKYAQYPLAVDDLGRIFGFTGPYGPVYGLGVSMLILDATGAPDKTVPIKPEQILAVYPDGRMLARNDNDLIRFNADGTRDFTFFPFRNELGFESPTILPDGRILLLVGRSENSPFGTSYSNDVTRLLSDGRPDSGFPRKVVGYSFARGPIVLSPDGAFFVQYPNHSVLFTRHLGDPFPTTGNAIVELASDVFSAQEMAGKAEVVLHRRGNVTVRAMTRFEAIAEVTSAPVAITPHNGEVVFEPGEWHKVVALGVNDAPQNTGPRTVRISLTQAGPNATLGSRTNALIKIDDVYSEFAFKEASYWFLESDADAAVEIIRSGRTATAVVLSVELTRLAGPRLIGSKVSAANVVFAAGETRQLLRLGLKDDFLSEPDERLRPTMIQTFEGQYRVSRNGSEFVVLDDDRPGSLDGDFRIDPRVQTIPSQIVVQSDGGIVFASGPLNSLTNLVRLMPNGELDEKFHSELPADLPIGQMIAQSGGRLVLVTRPPNPLLLRLTADGRIDASFKMQEGPKPEGSRAAVWAGPDDSILLHRGDKLERLTSDGLPHADFSSVKMEPTAKPLHVLWMPNSNFVVASSFSETMAYQIEEFLPNGTRLRLLKLRDDTRSMPGLVIEFMDVQSSGKIVLVTRRGFLLPQSLVRWNSDLTPDDSFALATSINTPSANFSITDLLIQPDDKIVLSGWFPPSIDPLSTRLVRLNSDGSLDSSFNVSPGFLGPTHRQMIADNQGGLLRPWHAPVFNGLHVGTLLRLNLTERFRIASVVREKTGVVRLRVSTPFSQKARIETSENLSEWTLLNETTTNGIAGEFLDTTADNRQWRFYRAHLEK